MARGGEQGGRRQDPRQSQDAPDIEQQRYVATDTPEDDCRRGPNADSAFEQRSASVNEVIPHVGRAIVASDVGDTVTGELDGPAGHLVLRERALLCDILHHVAIAVTGGKIHVVINVSRVAAEGSLDSAHRLDEFSPIHRREKPKTADTVAHGDLVGRLVLAFELNEFFDGVIGLGKLLLKPAHRQGQARILASQAAGKFRDKRAGERRILADHVGQGQHQVPWLLLGDLQQAVCPEACGVAIPPTCRDPDGHAAQILDQSQTEHDRDRPQFAEFECDDGLVGGHEAAEVLGVHSPIHVRNQFLNDGINARIAGQRAVQEPRQFDAVLSGQVPPRRSNL